MIRKLSHILIEQNAVLELAKIYAKHNNVIQVLEGSSGIKFVIIDANKLYNYSTRMFDLRMQAYDKEFNYPEQDYSKVKYDADEIYNRMADEAPLPFEGMHNRYHAVDDRDIPGNFLKEVIEETLRIKKVISNSFKFDRDVINSHNLHYNMPENKPYHIIMYFCPINVGLFFEKNDSFHDHIEIFKEYTEDQITDMNSNNHIYNSRYLDYIQVVDNELFKKIKSETIIKNYNPNRDWELLVIDKQLKHKRVIEQIINLLQSNFKRELELDHSVRLDIFYEGHTTQYINNKEEHDKESVVKFCDEFQKIMLDNPNLCSTEDRDRLLEIFKWGFKLNNKYDKKTHTGKKFGII